MGITKVLFLDQVEEYIHILLFSDVNEVHVYIITTIYTVISIAVLKLGM